MPEKSTERSASSPTRERMIRRIADALGRPEAVFRDQGGPACGSADQGELLWIWNSLTDHADRQRILIYARAVAAERSGMVRP
ncbi:hypothetical protein MKK88_16450 [Methylobacterium sp. E-005]|uniref:hypothetical protein n=1 Tax=Methylobacterium sp. E-005 TaxID=2836549 RepID=UPI001FBABD2C|nr:hypothetical protein [Methylobacterium sp. E-005]MCJ2087560.1 hypothetical protein [Methylobacterium sp. E-005]